MAKKKTMYECTACGYETPKWLGRCPNCGGWNTLEEQYESPKVKKDNLVNQVKLNRNQEKEGKAYKLSDISYQLETRIHTKMLEFDRVLGGGVVPGSLVLIGGDPGIGKSTLLLQVSVYLAQIGQVVLYVSGEESLSQIKMRADRLKVESDQLYLMGETDLNRVALEIQRIQPHMVVIDSIQTMSLPEHTGVAGSVSQVRNATAQLMRIAKENQIAIFIVGHVTKDGNIAGPRMLEHMVDTVLYFEGEKYNRFRMLRAVKNRFGSTNEIGMFEMIDIGLQEVINPSQLFLEERIAGSTGSSVVASLEGTRTILAEIQSLMTPTVFGNAKRTASGIDYQRVSLLLAVMEKHCHLMVQNQDAFFKTTGGVRLDEPAIDMAIAVSIASSYWNQPVNIDDCFIGEIGLTGEIRRVSRVDDRIKEAEKLGFKRIFIPASNYEDKIKSNHLSIQVKPVKTIQEVLQQVFPNQ